VTESTLTRQQFLAARVGPLVSLKGIHTRSISGELLDPSAEGPFDFDLDVSPTFNRDGDYVLYQFDYTATARIDEQDVARFALSLVLVYTPKSYG
jgi:hypothetical protein